MKPVVRYRGCVQNKSGQVRSWLFGAWTHGGCQGLSKQCKARPKLTRLINAFLQTRSSREPENPGEENTGRMEVRRITFSRPAIFDSRTRYRAPAPCPRPPPRTVRAPDIALPPLVSALHRAPSAHRISRHRPRTRYRAPAPCMSPPPSTVHRPRARYRAAAPCPHPPPRTVRAPDIALSRLVPAVAAHPKTRSPPSRPPSTAHRPRSAHPISRFCLGPCPRPPPRTVRAPSPRPPPRTVRAPDIALPPLAPPSTAHRPHTLAPDIALPPLVPALHRAPSPHLPPPRTVRGPDFALDAPVRAPDIALPAPCPRPPPRTVRVEGGDKGRERDIGCADGARWRAWTRGGSAISGARTVRGGGRGPDGVWRGSTRVESSASNGLTLDWAGRDTGFGVVCRSVQPRFHWARASGCGAVGAGGTGLHCGVVRAVLHRWAGARGYGLRRGMWAGFHRAYGDTGCGGLARKKSSCHCSPDLLCGWFWVSGLTLRLFVCLFVCFCLFILFVPISSLLIVSLYVEGFQVSPSGPTPGPRGV